MITAGEPFMLYSDSEIPTDMYVILAPEHGTSEIQDPRSLVVER
jgi:hypothetical protein